MTESAQYSPAQLAEIKEAFGASQQILCPVCGSRMTARGIGGGSFGLGYSRKREWLICTGCHRSAIFDVKRGTRN